MLQLNPPLPMITPKGNALAHFVLDYGPEFDLHWTVFLDSNGECWTFNNREIRACKNITLGRVDVPLPVAAHAVGKSRTSAAAEDRPLNSLSNGTRHDRR